MRAQRTQVNAHETEATDKAFTEMAHETGDRLFQRPSAAFNTANPESPFPGPDCVAAGREERDLGGTYCTVKPGWKRRIPSDLRS